MNNKTLIGAVAVLLVAAAGYWIWQSGQTGKLEFPSSTLQQEQAGEVQEVTVTGTEFAFTPREITAKVGQPVRVTFINGGQYPHNFVIPDLGVSTRTISPGEKETIQFTVTERGSLSMATVCTVPGHKEAGMIGVLRVE